MAIVTISVISCSDENPIETMLLTSAPHAPHLPYNPSNPYDSTGIRHNLIVEFLEQYIDETDSTANMFWAGIIDGIEAFKDSVGMSCSTAQEIADSIRIMISREHDDGWVIDQIKIGPDSNITQRELDYLAEMADAVYEAGDSAGLMNAIFTIETNMMAISWDTDETYARRAISIIKNSSYLWLTKDIEKARQEYAGAWDLYAYQCSMNTQEEPCSEDEAGMQMAIVSMAAYEGYQDGWQLGYIAVCQ